MTSWSDQLTHAGGKTHREPQLRRNLYAAILAQACNFGPAAMAEASGISEETLRWTTEWYLREETLLREANAAIVNHHHGLPLASVWGGGTMSSSDGQRFPMRGKSLTARAMTHLSSQTIVPLRRLSTEAVALSGCLSLLDLRLASSRVVASQGGRCVFALC